MFHVFLLSCFTVTLLAWVHITAVILILNKKSNKGDKNKIYYLKLAQQALILAFNVLWFLVVKQQR